VKRSIGCDRLWAQRLRHASPAATAEYLSDGRWRRARHLEHLDGILRDALADGGARIIIEWPPGHGKSRYLSVWTPVWFLNAWPARNVILASNTATLAQRWGREVRNVLESEQDRLEVRLAEDSQARGDWSTTAGGGMLTKGIGGTIMGFRPHLMVIDDPHEGQAEANSETKRLGVWDWWQGQARSRLEPGASVIVLHQRLHEEDLIGRLTAEPDHPWRVITLRAIAEDDDPLGREPGEALWPERFPVEALEELRRDMGSRAFEAQYQQRPAPAGGAVFRRSWFQYYRSGVCSAQGEAYFELIAPDGQVRRVFHRDCRWFQTVDTALKPGMANDWTVVGTFALTPKRELVVVDVWREKLAVPDQLPFILRARRAYQARVQWTGVEDRGSGTGILQAARIEGVHLRPLDPGTKSKEERATPAAVLAENGSLWFPEEAPWLGAFEAELLTFPSGRHDDQVDVLSYAAHQATRRAPRIVYA
jgi:predicted phage terminase large subunit-like protein